MSNPGFIEEDDLILYAMQALSSAEMAQIAGRVQSDPGVASRLRSIEQVLGVYASATVEFQDAPVAALDRLMQAVSPVPAPQATPSPRPGTVAPAPKPSWASRLGLIWAGWAVAALLLLGFAVQYRRSRQVQQTATAKDSDLQAVQEKLAALAAQRDQLQASLEQQNAEAQKSQQAASLAESRSNELSAQIAKSKLEAERESGRAEELAAAARQTAEERNQLNAALAQERQTAAQNAESKQVLAALADPTALHVTLTVPKQKKQPSGRGTYLASSGTLVFTGSDLGPLPAGKVYELWLLPADGSAPVAAGTFKPDASGNATLISSHASRVAAKGFAITAEAEGGSLTPTMPILLVGGA